VVVGTHKGNGRLGSCARGLIEDLLVAMPLVDPDLFADKDVAPVYVARRLPEAKRVESALSEYGIDYAVDIETFRVHLFGIIPRDYEGVGFYVLQRDAHLARRALRDAALTLGLVEEDED